MKLDCRDEGAALPLPLAGEGWGEGVSSMGQSPRGESPLPARGSMLRIARTRRPLPQAGEVNAPAAIGSTLSHSALVSHRVR
ncbi:hypothetical protein E4K66_15450 [Bradyrhizobium frederickii]|uniref:Uncharacterized protein n=1 Tax=Bradyrhizobium frederickii TaxID=2560054 RepID=A0A4Y9L7U1_9BRAD|nr:hypothetical protein E4K66_15450 [Bradyrhizobium frederickii]